MPVVLRKNASLPAGSLDGEIASRLAAGRSGSFFYVAPTRRRIRHLQGEFLSLCPREASGPMHLFTLETLAAALCDLLLPHRRLLTVQLQSALVQEAIRSCGPGLKYFRLRGPARRLPRGTLQKITNVINRMKETGVYLSVLQEEIGGEDESEQLKLRDILAIYEAYEKLLGERYIDAPGLLKEANHAWTIPGSEAAFRGRYPDVDLVAVSGFDEFSDPELTLVDALSGVGGLSTVVTFDYHPDNDPLFGHLKENYGKFLAMGFRKTDLPGPGTKSFREHAARHLFGSELPDSERYDGRSDVTLAGADDRLREVELIARIVKSNAAGRGAIPLHKICVSMPRPDLYAALFREVFEDAGIPANITDRFGLDQSPLVSGLLSLLAVAQNNFRTADIMRALSCPYFDFSTDRGPIDPGNLGRIAAGLKIVHGRKKWNERIAGRLRFLRSPAAREGEEYGPGRLAREIADLERASGDIGTITTLLGPFYQPMKPADFTREVTGVMKRLMVVESLTAPPPDAPLRREDIEREARAYAELTAFLGDFPEILSREMLPGETRPLAWYLERFRPLLSQVRYNVRQKFGEGVLVTSIDETRGLSFELMILAGLVDGEFPCVYEPEVFLPPRRREKRERYHLHGERYLFYQAVTNFSKRLYLTFPLRENGVDLGRSEFVDALGAVAAVTELPALNIYTDIIPSRGELIETAGRALAAAGEGAVPAETLPGDIPPGMRSHIMAAISMEENRRLDTGDARFRGVFGEGLPTRATDSLKKYASGTFSATQLETYGDCPFRYFSERLLRLRVKEEPEEGMTPLELGSLLHEILYEYYLDRRERKLPAVACLDDAGFRSALKELRELAEKKFDALGSTDIFREITREGLTGSDERTGVLGEMLLHERDSGISAVPAYFEVRFGRAPGGHRQSDPVLSREEPVAAGGIFLRGKIDRIDVAERSFRIVDYKTGAGLPGKKEIEEGGSLQLPLYLHCAGTIISDATKGKLTGAAGVYYHLRSPFHEMVGMGSAEHKGEVIPPQTKSRLLPSDEALRARVDSAVALAGEYASRIAGGRFPVEPRDAAKICRTCDFIRICRIRTRFAGDADPERVDGTDTGE